MDPQNPSAREAAYAQTPPAEARRTGRTWQYREGFLVNEFVGRVGHTPAWIVEVEGSSFRWSPPTDWSGRIRRLFAKPRIIQRNRRRLAFAWPLHWPPPDPDKRVELVGIALDRARLLGTPTAPGCGVCGRSWEGGPTMLAGRARHLCPDCVEHIDEARLQIPPAPGTTWLWCLVAGFGGLMLQLLFHQTVSWTAAPAALISGWLMGLANAPNFERRPVRAPLLTIALVVGLQTAGLALLTGAKVGAGNLQEFLVTLRWTVTGAPPALIVGCVAGSFGVIMALFERRLRQP